jgi:hypothetical protein
LAVEWLYTVHADGAVVWNRADDRARAHAWADAYGDAGGAQIALVRQWVDFLDQDKP